MSATTTTAAVTNIEVVQPAEFGPVNYILLAISAIIGLGLLTGLVLYGLKRVDTGFIPYGPVSKTNIEVVQPVEFGPVNYILLAISAIIGLGLLTGLVILLCKECDRSKQAKINYVKERLNIRRKAISGISSLRRGMSNDSLPVSEATSYIQLTETPTSIRCSSAWTPSPITRVSASDTPTSGNFSI